MLLFVKKISDTNEKVKVIFNGYEWDKITSYVHTFEDKKIINVLSVGTKVSCIPLTHQGVNIWLYVTKDTYIFNGKSQLVDDSLIKQAIALGTTELTYSPISNK